MSSYLTITFVPNNNLKSETALPFQLGTEHGVIKGRYGWGSFTKTDRIFIKSSFLECNSRRRNNAVHTVFK